MTDQTSQTIPDCFYRISIKALVLNETRDKFLITKDVKVDPAGLWDVPGGGLDWGQTPKVDLQRELQEEMGVQATWIADQPSYFVTHTSNANPKIWIANLLYETTLDSLDFTPSDECVELAWVNAETANDYNLFTIVGKLAEQFDPKRHQH